LDLSNWHISHDRLQIGASELRDTMEKTAHFSGGLFVLRVAAMTNIFFLSHSLVFPMLGSIVPDWPKEH
jgi:hypothetical protein